MLTCTVSALALLALLLACPAAEVWKGRQR
jgi:hypothetical protein